MIDLGELRNQLDEQSPIIALLGPEFAALERHRCAVDGGERRAELVRRDGDELVLQPVELAQAVERVVLPTLVERDHDERPDERDREVRRAIP